MKKILIVEDESALQKMLGETLSQEGYQTVSALNGEIGLRLAAEESPDLIILDLVLPKKKGLEVLQELRENEKSKDIPVIVLTNLEQLQEMQQATELGAAAYLVKSNYELDEVVQKVKEALA